MFPVLFASGDLFISKDISMDQTTDFFVSSGVFSLIKEGVAAREEMGRELMLVFAECAVRVSCFIVEM